jgi:hypothetical protein
MAFVPSASSFVRYLKSLRTGILVSPKFDAIIATILLSIWLGAVIFTTTQHEYFRDEVRPLSMARAAHSALDLFPLIRYDGHPVLWFLLLYLGKSIVDTPLILPILSIAVASAAVTIFMLVAPFPLWFRTLFLFSALPFYEYSVMARNYGISMLLLFAAAAIYPYRKRHWWLLAIILALLANTNVHSVAFAGLIMAIWIWDAVVTEEVDFRRILDRSVWIPIVITGAGIVLCAAVTVPPKDTILTGIRFVTPHDIGAAFRSAVLEPDRTFKDLVPDSLVLILSCLFVYMAIWSFPRRVHLFLGAVAALIGFGLFIRARGVGNYLQSGAFLISTISLHSIVRRLVLYIAVLGLLRRIHLFLAALCILVGFGVFFRVGYPGDYRHEGLFLIFVLFLYWVALAEPSDRMAGNKLRSLFNAGLYGAVVILLVANVRYSIAAVRTDIRGDLSSSKAFATFLNSSNQYRDAILVPEPDYNAEPFPYYLHNLMIYIPREHRFGDTVSWSTSAASSLSLGQLLSDAQTLKAQYKRPVLIVLGHPEVDQQTSGQVRFSYNKTFTWSAEDREEAGQWLVPVADFTSAAGDENYRVYAVR